MTPMAMELGGEQCFAPVDVIVYRDNQGSSISLPKQKTYISLPIIEYQNTQFELAECKTEATVINIEASAK